MIAYLKGKVLFKDEDSAMVLVNGLGYSVFLSAPSLAKIKPGSVTALFVGAYLGREKIELYGCLNREEFSLFDFLERLPQIGPKTALALASAGSLANLKAELEKKNSRLLASIKGLGVKRKQRLVRELNRQLNGADPGALKQETLF